LEFTEDEGIRANTIAESLADLKPAFRKDGTITAGSASQISDGAAAVVVMNKDKAKELGLSWLVEIGAHGVVAGPDSTLQSQPANAIKKAIAREGITVDQLDVIEINEDFSGRVGLDEGARRQSRHRQRQRWRDRDRASRFLRAHCAACGP
jgi:acetyl-CoA C-acetyltransferase